MSLFWIGTTVLSTGLAALLGFLLWRTYQRRRAMGQLQWLAGPGDAIEWSSGTNGGEMCYSTISLRCDPRDPEKPPQTVRNIWRDSESVPIRYHNMSTRPEQQ